MSHRVTGRLAVVITVKNDPVGSATTLGSLVAQSRRPDEIIVVDGGSNDGTRRLVRQYQASLPQLRLIEAPGSNIACGRNIGVRESNCDIIATTDAGCKADPAWLERLAERFDESTEFVAGFYRVSGQSLFETVVGLATMRGQLDSVCPASFNPSARSLAITKSLWERAGGWPEWVSFSEDTLLDLKIRGMNVGWSFAPDAVVDWRPRTSFRSLFKQFYSYGTGRGHTQIDAPGYFYQIRNVLLVALVTGAAAIYPWCLGLSAMLFGYFFVWSLHGRGKRIANRTGHVMGYFVHLAVMWVVIAANTCGFIVGSFQRLRNQSRYKRRMDAYLASAPGPAYHQA